MWYPLCESGCVVAYKITESLMKNSVQKTREIHVQCLQSLPFSLFREFPSCGVIISYLHKEKSNTENISNLQKYQSVFHEGLYVRGS